ncbi:hypothetical protein QZH41_012084 [Actinostola sp. cb2023]|nr:hypothetical protein QZH41_012084 [Actinostola sp. cb2023]
MVQCFAPDCKHQSESHTCRFFGFPNEEKNFEEYKYWIKLIRREDKTPNQHSRVCSCHFRNGKKSEGPEIYERNKDKPFPAVKERAPPKKKKKTILKENHDINMQEIATEIHEAENTTENHLSSIPTAQVILEAELDIVKNELDKKQEEGFYKKKSLFCVPSK